MESTLLFFIGFCFLSVISAHRIEIITTRRPDGNVIEYDCNKPTDIVFVMDGSQKMSWKDFSQQKDFIGRFIQDMDISQDIVRVGVATISTDVRVDFSLNTFKSKSEIKTALSKITDPKGKAHTWMALDYLHTKAFSADQGGRDGVPRIAILLIDNISRDRQKTLEAAKRLLQDPVRVYAIGVENADIHELLAIASRPENIYLSSEFDKLKEIEVPIKENVCKLVCGMTPLDIIFVMDESTSLWNEDMENQLQFVDGFIKDSLIGPTYTQVGVVTFSTNVTNQFFLNQYGRSHDLLNALKAIKRTYGESYTDKALRFIKDQAFRPEHGGRPGVPHIVVLITDGQSSLPVETSNAAVDVHKSGITVFAIGVGTSVDVNELNVISGNPARAFQVLNYKALRQVETDLFARICGLRHQKKTL